MKGAEIDNWQSKDLRWAEENETKKGTEIKNNKYKNENKQYKFFKNIYIVSVVIIMVIIVIMITKILMLIMIMGIIILIIIILPLERGRNIDPTYG